MSTQFRIPPSDRIKGFEWRGERIPYPEKEINPFSFKRMVQREGFDVSFIPHFYSGSFRDCEMAVKRFYYLLEKYFPVIHLFLSPGFALLGVKRSLIASLGETNKI